MRRYRVYMERLARCTHQVEVEAESEDGAERAVRARDSAGEFEAEWDELQPDVATRYFAEGLPGERTGGAAAGLNGTVNYMLGRTETLTTRG